MAAAPADDPIVTPERLDGLPVGDRLREVGRFLRYVDQRGRDGRTARADAVLDARAEGWTRRAIADALGVGEDMVKAILRDTRPRE